MQPAPATRSPPSPAADYRGLWLAGALIVFATFAVYANSLDAPFVFDDRRAILENPTIRSLWPLSGPLSPPADAGSAIGRPLVNLSLAINFAFSGTSVRGYHLFNIGLHALNALILFGIVRRTSQTFPLAGKPTDKHASNRTRLSFGAAFSASLLWTLHPLLTESVVCVVQRTEVIVGFFYLLTLYCFIRGCENGAQIKWLVASVAACLAGMASKEVMVTAPVVILLYDRTFVAGSLGKAWRERKRYYFALAATWALLIGLMLNSPDRAGVAGFGTGVSSWDYLLTQCRALVIYLKLALWPHPLVVDYGTSLVKNISEILLPGLFILTLIVGTAIALWRRPVLGFIAACFFIILSPSSSFVPLASQTVAEHRMYLPLAPIIVLFIGGGFRLFGSHLIWASLPLALLAGLATHQRNKAYASELALWTDTVTNYPQNARAQVNLGNILQSSQRLTEAIAHYQESIRLDPLLGTAYVNLASAYLSLGKTDLAIAAAEAGVKTEPRDANAHINLGLALAALDRLTEAVPHYEEALRLEPHAADAETYLGSALIRLGRAADATRHYQNALHLQPTNATAWSALAESYFEQKDHTAARYAAEQALKFKPENPQGLYTLGNLDAVAGEFSAAIVYYRRALELAPDYIAARNNLANALLVSGHIDEAVFHYREILRHRPDDRSVTENLTRALELQQPKSP